MDKSIFHAWWPEAQRCTRSALRRRGLRHEDINDVLQLTAERAIRSSTEFISQEHFTSWCLRASRHASIDEWRRTRRESLVDAPDRGSADVAEQVMARFDLAAVEAQIALLPKAQRDAILSFETVSGDRQATYRMSSARRLARQKLRRVIEGTAAAFGGRIGLIARRLRSLVVSPFGVAGVAGIAVAVLLGTSLQAPAGSAAPSPPLSRPDSPAHPVRGSQMTASDVVQTAVRKAIAGVVSARPPGDPSVVPHIAVPIANGPNGEKRRIEVGPSTEDKPLVCLSRTPATQRLCADPPVPAVDSLLGLDLI